MQDRYAGDVGDFGKLGLLRSLEASGLKVGINWYLVGDENHNNDGKHIGYLEDKKFKGCDDELLKVLKNMFEASNRSVAEIEKLDLLSTGKYYHERIMEPRMQKSITRDKWHCNALGEMSGCDLVFLDPDNGLIPKSVSRGSNKSIKYVFPEEIIDYFKAGHSVVFYNHRTREKLDVYLERFTALFHSEELKNASKRIISFRRGTVRDYIFLLHEEHVLKAEKSLEQLFDGKWGLHFRRI